jgi:hypothetical protein
VSAELQLESQSEPMGSSGIQRNIFDRIMERVEPEALCSCHEQLHRAVATLCCPPARSRCSAVTELHRSGHGTTCTGDECPPNRPACGGRSRMGCGRYSRWYLEYTSVQIELHWRQVSSCSTGMPVIASLGVSLPPGHGNRELERLGGPTRSQSLRLS